MEEYTFVAAVGTPTEEEIYNNTNGLIVKTILLGNDTDATKEATLTFDDVAFNFDVEAGKTTVISSPIMTRNIKLVGEGISVHLTGLQIGGE